jgi:hypothetical protein
MELLFNIRTNSKEVVMKLNKTLLMGAAAGVLLSMPSQAAIVEIESGFGALPGTVVSAIGLNEGDIFGGDGIPSDTLNWKTLDTNDDGTADLVMGMSATQRFGSPVVTNDGAGTYFAGPGESDTDRSLWNFNFILGSLDGSDISQQFAQNNGPYSVFVEYELDPDTNESAQFAADLLPVDPSVSSILQFSYNLGFAFLGTENAGFNFGPALDNGESYDAFANGTYSFNALLASAQGSNSVGIDVVVEANAPAALALFGLGIAGLVRLRRR